MPQVRVVSSAHRVRSVAFIGHRLVACACSGVVMSFLIAEVLLSFASAIRRCATKAEARQKDRNRVEQAFWAVRATNSMQWLA